MWVVQHIMQQFKIAECRMCNIVYKPHNKLVYVGELYQLVRNISRDIPHDPGVYEETVWHVGDGVVSDVALGAYPEPVSPTRHEPVARTVAVALREHWRLEKTVCVYEGEKESKHPKSSTTN